MCILTEENFAFIHSADQKNCLHVRDFAYSSLHFKQEWPNLSPTHSSTPPRQHLSTHTHKQINIAS